jgi:hypothetical protein
MSKEDVLIALRYNSVVLELKLIESELEYCNAVIDGARNDFSHRFRYGLQERNLYIPGSDEDPPPLNREQRRKRKKKTTEEIKRLYKKIAAATHPDKMAPLDDFETHRREELFKRAAAAFECGDATVLRELARELDIKAPPLTQDDIDCVVAQIKEKQAEVSGIRGMVVYAWALASQDEDKDRIMKKYLDFIEEASTQSIDGGDS